MVGVSVCVCVCVFIFGPLLYKVFAERIMASNKFLKRNFSKRCQDHASEEHGSAI